MCLLKRRRLASLGMAEARRKSAERHKSVLDSITELENSNAARGRPAGTFKSRIQLSCGFLVGTLYRPVLDLYEHAATQLGLENLIRVESWLRAGSAV